MNILNLIGLFGLFLDVMGAWFISRGLATKTLKEIQAETGFSYGPNEAYILSGISQKIECRFGFVFLFLGFCFQGSSYIFTSKFIISDLQFIILLIMLLFSVYILYKVSNTLLNKQIQIIRTNFIFETLEERKKVDDKMMHLEDIKRYLSLLKIRYHKDISQEDAWNQLNNYFKSS